MTDTADRHVAAVIARILRAPPSTDPDVLALHVVTALRGHGWRPSNVTALPPRYEQPAVPPLAANVVRAYAQRARQAITREDPGD